MTQPLFFFGKTARSTWLLQIKFVTLQYITFTTDQSYDSQQPRRQPSQARNHWLD